MQRAALFTDARVRELAGFLAVQRSLAGAGIDVAIYDRVRVEPTDASFLDAARFLREAKVDGVVSLGGGSVIDTAKAANLFATHPAELLAYVNAPLGEARPVPGPLLPHLACPTTSGTGSEVTGIAVCDIAALHVKTGIASMFLRPSEAIVDPDVTATLPSEVVAASGMDVLCHALESFTARPYTQRKKSGERPMSQGRNPWSDLGCREALTLLGEYFLRAVHDPADHEAREHVMWAATLAGIAFGNAGVHVPHGMAYAVAGLVRDYRPSGYPPGAPMVPHGVSVVLSAPAVFLATARACPERHLEAAERLGADVRGAGREDGGALLSARLCELMQKARIPNGLAGVGYATADVPALTKGAAAQERLMGNAPIPIDHGVLSALFDRSLACW
jgi:alcohol dehydrogenase class IV